MTLARVPLVRAARCAMVLLMLGPGAGVARAQAPDPAQAEPVQWQGNAVVSIAVQAGVTDQRTVSLSTEAFRRDVGWSYAAQADYTYSSIRFGPDFQTVADSQNARFTAERDLTEVLYFVLRPAFKRNEVQAVDYRFEGLAGLGVRLVRQARAQIDVLGGAGFVSQEKNVPEVDGTDGVGGVVQTSQFALNERWRFTELALFLAPFSESEDYRMQFQAALTGAIAGPLAMSVSYTMDRENIVLGGNEKTDRRFNVGVQINF